jgi:hypothetical protein
MKSPVFLTFFFWYFVSMLWRLGRIFRTWQCNHCLWCTSWMWYWILIISLLHRFFHSEPHLSILQSQRYTHSSHWM